MQSCGGRGDDGVEGGREVYPKSDRKWNDWGGGDLGERWIGGRGEWNAVFHPSAQGEGEGCDRVRGCGDGGLDLWGDFKLADGANIQASG